MTAPQGNGRRPRISVAINTLNEEQNIRYALGSVAKWVDEIVVVDMHSEDRTVEIAKSFGAQVYFHERTGYVEPARKFAQSMTTGDWILTLDADEMITPPLSRLLVAAATEDTCDVVRIPRLNYFSGEPMLHAKWEPETDYQLRFYKRGFVYHPSNIHTGPTPIEGARVASVPSTPFDLAMVHFNYVDMTQFIEKLNRYTSIEAREAYEKGDTIEVVEAIGRANEEFWERFRDHHGSLGGWRGFYYSAMMAFYRLAIAAKLAELREIGTADDIRNHYRQTAERILTGDVKEWA